MKPKDIQKQGNEIDLIDEYSFLQLSLNSSYC